MTTFFTVAILLGVALLVLILYALFKGTGDGDEDFNYMEEYGDEDDFMNWDD